MAKKVVNLEAKAVAFDFTKDGGPKVEIALADLPADIVTRLALHGLSQKVGDSYANAKNQADPVKWAVDQVAAVIKGLVGGVFNAGRTGEGATKVSMLARALHRIKLAAGDSESTAEAAQAFIDGDGTPENPGLTKEQIAEYKSKKKVAKMLDVIRLEDAQERLDRAQKKATASAGLSEEDDE